MASFSYLQKVVTADAAHRYCWEKSRQTITHNYVKPPPADFSNKAPVVKGDHKTDYPYAADWQETTPFVGEMTLKSQVKAVGLADQWCANRGTFAEGFIPFDAGMPSFAKTPIPSEDPHLREFLRKAATTSALADAQRSLMNIGVLLGERRETMQLLVKKTNQLTALATQRQRASLRTYLASRWRDRRKVARDLASEHLAFLFGVLPLVGEIEGLMELLEQGEPVRITGRGRRADVVESFPTVLNWRAGTNAMIGIDYESRIITRHSVRVSLKYDVTLPAALKAQQLGFNGLAVFYDLVPLSFLSDFISNTGQFIRGLGYPGLTYATGSWTYFREATRHVIARHADQAWNGKPNATIRSGSGTAEANVKAGAMVRSVYSTEPEADWLFMNNLSWAKAVTLLSLAVQRKVEPLRKIIRKKPFRYRGPRPRYLPPINYG